MPVTLNASTATGFITTSDTSGTVALQANGTTKLTVSSTGVNIGQYTPSTSLITSDTVQNSTSGTAIDFTGIPSWVKRITVMLAGVSTNSSSSYLFQLGTSSGVTTTGYINYGMNFGSGSGSGAGYSNGFNIKGPGASEAASGSIIITNLTSNTWTAFGMLGSTSTNTGFLTAGSIALGGTLDRVRFTTSNGTDTFDAGSINILYEG